MNVTVDEFISANQNKGVKWKIDGELFTPNKFIPDNLLEKYVVTWTVNQWEGIIEIMTE